MPCRLDATETVADAPSPSLVLRLGAEDELEPLPRPGGRWRARLGGGAHWARLGELERGHGGEERVDGRGDEGVDEGGQQLLRHGGRCVDLAQPDAKVGVDEEIVAEEVEGTVVVALDIVSE